MRYSVWDPYRRDYTYYDAPGELSGGTFAPKPVVRPGHRLGVSPDAAARPLPVGAVLVGRGNLPMGMIARSGPVAVGALGLDPGTFKIGMLLASAFLIWKYLVKPGG